MRRLLKIFFRSEDSRPLVVLLCLLMSSIADAASIGTMLPAVTALAGGDSQSSSPINAFVRETISRAGFEPGLGNLILLMAVLMVIKGALGFAALSYAGISAARVSIALRRRLIQAIFDAKWSYFASQSGGRFANAISNDAGRAGDAFLLSAQVLALLIQSAAYGVIAFLISWRLAAIGLTASLLVALMSRGLIRGSRKVGYKQTGRTSALTILMVDMLTNIKPLKTMQRYEPMLAEIKEVLRRLKRALVTKELSKSGLAQGLNAVIGVMIGIGAYAASTYWHAPLPELVVSAIVLLQILNVTSKFLSLLQQSAQLEAAHVRTMELIELTESQHEENPGRKRPAPACSCRFEHVDFSHDRAPVVSDVSFEIPARAITVLSGASGAGKTTIIDLLIGLNRPDQGRITIDGTPLSEIDLTAWRKMIGYVPQELSLFHASIRDNITLGDKSIPDTQVLDALTLAGASGFISELPEGLDTNVGEMGGKFSGGQRQRISLARALVTKPDVLILDEVTSALDPATEEEIVGNIKALRGQFTIVAITHRPAWTEIADRLYRVASGKVTRQGVPSRKPGRAEERQPQA